MFDLIITIMAAIAALVPAPADDYRYCYDQGNHWGCYLAPDRPAAEPVWEGPRADIPPTPTPPGPQRGSPEWIRNLEPCEYEDSEFCYWDAKQNGNHEGRSFWSDEKGGVHYYEIPQ